MEFIPGKIAPTGDCLLIGPTGFVEDDQPDDQKIKLRDRDDKPVKLEPGTSVVVYGLVASKRSKRNRRLLVHEVYVQTSLEVGG